MLFLNLCIADGFSKTDLNQNSPDKSFYKMKAVFAIVMFVVLSLWSYSDYTADLAMFENDFKSDTLAEKQEDDMYMLVIGCFTVYIVLLGRYSHKAIQANSSS